MTPLEDLLVKIDALPEVEEEETSDEKLLAAIVALTEVVRSLRVSPESIAELRGEVRALGAQLSTLCSAVDRVESKEPPESEEVDLAPIDRKLTLIADALSRVSERVTGLSGEVKALKASSDAARTVADAVVASKAGGFEFEISPTETTPGRTMRVKPT